MASYASPVLSKTSLLYCLASADPGLCSHGRRVGLMARMLAECMDLSAEVAEQVEWAGRLHDLGKLFIPTFLVRKRDALNRLEYRIMQRHASLGAEVLLRCPETAPLAEVARHHHERWDGAGYPSGLARCEIPLLVRITSVADVYDAVTSARPGGSRSHDEAMSELVRCRGRQLCPEVVEAFLRIESQVASSWCRVSEVS